MFQEAPKNDWNKVKITLEETFKQPLEDIFEDFEVEPVSSASIAQVHIATLKTGEKVAVKVQHDWMKEELPIDLHLIDFFVKTGFEFFPDFDYRWLPRNLKNSLPEELDFRIEARNAKKCQELFKENKKIKIPRIYENLSSEKVLVMEYVEGVNIDHTTTLKKEGYNLSEICGLLSDCFSQQIFRFGVVHADPHSGNVFVRKHKENGTQLILLDHGLYRYLSDSTRLHYSYLWKGIILQDVGLIKKGVKGLGVGEEYFPLFTAMVTHKGYEVVMDKQTKNDLKKRLGEQTKGDKDFAKEQAQKYRKEISICLRDMRPELHLIFKVDNYLRTIDHRLGKPVNTYYYTVNEFF